MDIQDVASRAGVYFDGATRNALFAPNDVLEIIDYCKEGNIIILGLEGFYVNKETVRPDMEAIADFSSLLELPWSKAVLVASEEATSFISKFIEKGLLFDIGAYSEIEIKGSSSFQ